MKYLKNDIIGSKKLPNWRWKIPAINDKFWRFQRISEGNNRTPGPWRQDPVFKLYKSKIIWIDYQTMFYETYLD